MSKSQRLKTTISEQILEFLANQEGMTISDYGSVYDSEEHEGLVNKIMELFATHQRRAVIEGRKEQIMQDELSLEDLCPQYDESTLIAWRLSRIAALEAELKEKESQ